MGNKVYSNEEKLQNEEKLKNLKLFQDKEILFKKNPILYNKNICIDIKKKKIIRSSINLEKLMNIGKEISNQIISTTINSDINVNLLSSSLVPDLTTIPNYQGESSLTANYKNLTMNYNYLRDEKSVLHKNNIEGIFTKNRKYFENDRDMTLKDQKSLTGLGFNKTTKTLNKSVSRDKKKMNNSMIVTKDIKSSHNRLIKSQEPKRKDVSNDKFNKRLLYIKPLKLIKKPKENEFNTTMNTVNSKNKNNLTLTVVHKLDQNKLNEYYARKNKKNKKKRKLDMTFS